MEILIVGAIIIFILIYNNTIDKDKFFEVLRKAKNNLVFLKWI